MVSELPTDVRNMLRSGYPVEIGRPRSPRANPAASRTRIALGFAAIYLIWGSTYLGIRYAIETIPPFLMMAIRHSVAGLVVYAWARKSGAPAPTPKQWSYALFAGLWLFLAGHGVLAWAEQKVPSGLAALLCATLPLWMVLLGRVNGTERKLGMKVTIGLALGFVGVGLLIGPEALRGMGVFSLLAAVAVVFSSFSWAVGSIYSKSVALPASTNLSAAMQMLAGGTSLLLISLLNGEVIHLHAASVSLRSILALAYLIVFGSIIAFTVFTWLMTVSTPSRISTYAYVNPVIAVFLGWALAGEAIGVHTVVATVVILVSVALVNTRKNASPGLPGSKMEANDVRAAVGD